MHLSPPGAINAQGTTPEQTGPHASDTPCTHWQRGHNGRAPPDFTLGQHATACLHHCYHSEQSPQAYVVHNCNCKRGEPGHPAPSGSTAAGSIAWGTDTGGGGGGWLCERCCRFTDPFGRGATRGRGGGTGGVTIAWKYGDWAGPGRKWGGGSRCRCCQRVRVFRC